jgi:hypothetical protein
VLYGAEKEIFRHPPGLCPFALLLTEAEIPHNDAKSKEQEKNRQQ